MAEEVVINEHKAELPPHLSLDVPLVPSKAPDSVDPVEEKDA